VSEVEDILYGIGGEPPDYRIRRDGAYHVISGQTGSGRYLRIVGEFLADMSFRPFGAREMTSTELSAYRKGK
jgi:hypothetical protein